MALFDKLFSLKRRLDCEDSEPRRYRGRSCQINPEQVRLLLFKECDWRGRRLLFDSSAIHKVPAGKNDKPTIQKTDEAPCIVEVSNGYSYVYKGPEADAKVLGEMIFGAVAMNCKSVSLKIHIMDEPRRLMCTKVFCVPTSRRISRVERKTSDRLDEQCMSKPLSVPALREEGVSLSFSLERGDSGFYGDHSQYSSASSTYDYFSMFETWDGCTTPDDFCSFNSLPGRKLSTSSNGSWQRRTFQNIATRFDLGQSSQYLNLPSNATSSDSQIYSNSSTSGTSESLASGSGVSSQKKSKLGLAVLITVTDSAEMDLVRRCVEHSPQVTALVCRLRIAALSAGAHTFVSTLHAAKEDAARWLSDLIYGVRLQPIWLPLVSQEPRTSHKLADSLLTDLCAILAAADTKTTHFFISTLLTHVLTYHLGWVSTVSPYDTVEHRPPTAARPYNALWAQLSDLCGTIGVPSRAARTILTGEKNQHFLNRLLLVLTYFLRCGDVTKTIFRYQKCEIKEVKTVNVNVKSNLDVQNTLSDSSVSTLIASEVSFKRSPTLANLSQKLSSAEVGSSTGANPTGLRRNPTVMHRMQSSSDSSLSSASDDSLPEQKVLFVLGDDDKLVGLKNKSNGGKMVKRSSKVQEPEPNPADCAKPTSERSPDSPSKCCGQTLQHSKPIKHSGFKFEFDKYPQIVTNYMKSKNLEILDRHYIGKPGNLKLDNFQFDPMIVPAIQEERCETCVKCQMELMLQTPTNASEMEYMNDMPRASEPQYATPKIVTEKDQTREISPKTFVRRRKHKTVVVNLASCIKSVSDGAVNREEKNSLSDRICMNLLCSNGKPTIPVIMTPESPEENTDSTDNQVGKISSKQMRNKSSFHANSKLKSTKSLGNLKLLMCESESEELDTTPISSSDWRISSNDTLNVSNEVKSSSLNELQSIDLQHTETSLNESKATSETRLQTLPDKETLEKTSSKSSDSTIANTEISKMSLQNTKSPVLSDDSITTISSLDEKSSETSSEQLPSEMTDTSLENDKSLEANTSKTTPIISAKPNSDPSSNLKPMPLELKMPVPRRLSKDVPKIVEVKQVIEYSLPKMCSTEDNEQRSGFDSSLLGGVTDHYVPDLVLQGTLAKPIVWEAELRRDLDLTSYLNKTVDSPIQAVAIIGDTNTWEVRVVGRDCGTGGMSSLVGAMLDALPAMWKAKVPAHQCITFLESKLREFCVLSKTLADMLMSTDFCDIATLTKSLNIDVNDVPLLLAVATTHTPQVATRYGLSYR